MHVHFLHLAVARAVYWALQPTLNDIKADISSMRNEISSMKGEIASLSERIDSLTAEVASRKEEPDETQDSMNDTKQCDCKCDVDNTTKDSEMTGEGGNYTQVVGDVQST